MEAKTIAIQGVGGQIGRALLATFQDRPGWRAVPLHQADLEITDAAAVDAFFAAGAPDVFVNTAYFAAEEAEPALRVNALGPQLLAHQCARHGSVLVQISTDYVFSGETDRPYREDDCAEPRSIYGISKLTGELLVRAAAPDHLIVRVSSLYGLGGSRAKGGTNFVSDMLAMHKTGKTPRVVTDQIHSPTYAPDAAQAIAALLEKNVRGTVHVSNAGMCSKFDFAVAAFKLAGLDGRIDPITLADLPPRPPRPCNTALATERLVNEGIGALRPWEEGLRDYVSLLAKG
jgi:dTDP-4-dehydrorhamnose reductase